MIQGPGTKQNPSRPFCPYRHSKSKPIKEKIGTGPARPVKQHHELTKEQKKARRERLRKAHAHTSSNPRGNWRQRIKAKLFGGR
jgi:hypothetical protein